MTLSRRKFLMMSAAVPIISTTACSTARFGSSESYLSQVVSDKHNCTVFYWLDVILQQTRDQRVAPPRAAYNFAMPSAAGFVAANAVESVYNDDFQVGPAPAGVHPEIAYGIAFSYAAAEVFQQPFVVERRRFLSKFANDDRKSVSIAWGKKVAKHIIRLRNDDGSEPSEVNYYLGRYQRRNDSLKWSPTGPFYSAAPGPAFGSFARGLFPGHGKIKPWTMTSSSQFRVRPFYDARSPEFAKEFDLIKNLGGANSRLRTADQAEIALFWEDGPWGITPPGHFLYIAAQVLQDRDDSFIDQARHFALLGMTQCDASINAWDNKYFYDVLRPESAIRQRASTLANPDSRVTTDKNWRSYIPTPEFPAYTSGHSTFGAVGVELIKLIRGSDKVNMKGQSPDLVLWPQLRGIQRHWTSLDQIADENGLSRLYGGVHWELDHTQAMWAGREIARHAFQNSFQRRA